MEHPNITKMNRTGELTITRNRYCPSCGAELDEESVVYRLNIRGIEKIIGCGECVESKTPAEVF